MILLLIHLQQDCEPMIDVIIRNKIAETANIVSFELAAKNGENLPEFETGSHIDVVIDGDITRQYSLINHSQSNQFYKIAVLKDPDSRGGSLALHDKIKIGDIVSISEPRNLFPLDVSSNKVLLFAGGIGITPIMSMAIQLDALSIDFELHYHTKSQEQTAFYQQLLNSSFASKVYFHFSDKLKQDLKQLIGEFQQGMNLYTCGPSGYMEHVFACAKANLWQDEHLHKENFKAEPLVSDGTDKPFKIILTRSGLEIDVATDQTALEAIEDAGVEIDMSCEMGVCGTCVTAVTGGIPDHRDAFLTAQEKAKNNQFTPCCSRALSDSLTLDL
ncbi:oxidoreductase [Paraglaciecola chathamensis]|uniref:Oxidoreductase n=1 Tax=Paraglaciecola chathamensis TaxID=368405 RepID=A0ABS0WGN6_9ALTE|nr:PDR/VanB family oxidoreductase [Paraglaciecola chathamensis]MBJ2137641.1 oxidoreductase [Paraglaciecola chathamensis]